MEILAIRGRNLASLAGDFEVDFETGPLSSAGLFAITGPTGAGKSTLLDAMCLALYDEVPRLKYAPNRGQVSADPENALSASDNRAIMRHGTADCYAEVVFKMPDGMRYAAKWAVRRSRGKSSGKMQKIEHSFENLENGAKLGGTKRETLAAIEQVIGLKADQFYRAVMLAQGDFEAFIRADSDDRARLLERLTGTEIYAELGKNAYAREKACRERLQQLETQIKAQSGLSDSERSDIQNALAAEKATIRDLQSQNASLEKDRQWELRLSELQAEYLASEQAIANAQRKIEDSKPLQNKIDLHKQVLRQIPLLQNLSKTQSDRDQIQTEHETTKRLLEQTTLKIEEAELSAEKSLNQQRTAELSLEELQPILLQARLLDSQIENSHVELSKAQANAATLSDKCYQLGKDHQAALAALNTAQARQTDLQNWFSVSDHIGRVAGRIDEIATTWQTYNNANNQRSKAEQSAAAHDQTVAAQTVKIAEFTAKLDLAEHAHTQAVSALEDLKSQSLNANDFQQLQASLDQYRELETLHQAAVRDQLKLQEKTDILDQLVVKHADLRTQLDHNADKITQSKLDLIAAKEKADKLKLEADFLTSVSSEATLQLRADLRPEEPCPVCGSKEHQLEIFEKTLTDNVKSKKLEAQKASEEASDKQQRTQQLEANQRAKTTQLEDLEKQIPQAKSALEQAQKDVAESTSKAHLVSKVLGLDMNSVDLSETITAEIKHLSLRAQNAIRIQGELEQAQAARDYAVNFRNSTQEELQTAKDELTSLETQSNQLRSDLHLAIQGQSQASKQLDSDFGITAWRELADPLIWLEQQVALWVDNQSAFAEITQKLPELAAAEKSLATALVHATEQHTTSCLALETAQNQHEAQQNARHSLLGSQNCDIAEQSAKAAVEAAREHHAKMQANLAEIRQTLIAATTSLNEKQAQHEKLETKVKEAEAELNQHLEALSLTKETFLEIAQDGQAGIDLLVTEMRQLEDDLTRAHSRHQSCRKALCEHQESSTPILTGDALQISLETVRASLEASQQNIGRLENQLEQDNKVMAYTADLRTKLAQEAQAADIWLRLSEVIGCAEGKKFRKFAQSLTLDMLLEQANQHLKDLKPRYTLQRAMGGDMLIQVVDHDLADDVRGLHNLSGGERFLISLALALGLAEMSSRGGVKLQSLFIDEGFGALDPASLGQALALLEHLQANGRRVGLISHVEELKERIAVKILVTPTGQGTSKISYDPPLAA